MTRLSREQSRNLTQQKLRAAALQQFVSAGFAGTSIDAMAEAAGFSRGAFYANYQSKHEIMLALLHEQNTREVEEWRLLIDSTGIDEDFFAAVARRFEKLIDETPWGLFSVEVQLQARRDALFADAFQHYLDATMHSMRELIICHFRRIEQALPPDLVEVTQAFYSLAIGLALTLDPQRVPGHGKRAGLIVARFLRGLGADSFSSTD